jgi:hypothetical protein
MLDQLFDDFVGGGEQRRRQGNAKHPRGLGVDDQLELGRLHDRKVRRLGALEDATDVDAELAVGIRKAGSISPPASANSRDAYVVGTM